MGLIDLIVAVISSFLMGINASGIVGLFIEIIMGILGGFGMGEGV